MTAAISTKAQGGAPVWLAGALALLLLVGAGVAYRAAASRLQQALSDPVELPVPLIEIPTRIEGWVGTDMELPQSIRNYMASNFADDYVRRQYVKETAAGPIWSGVYVVYCSSRPGGLLGHRPRVCYPANGWNHDETVSSEIVSRSGRRMKCLVHQFRKPGAEYGQIFVLSFYVLNGQITLSEDEFSGVFGRRPNLSGNPARYVAQVQVSSMLEHSARAAASDMVDVILAYLPDPNGHVAAVSFADGTVGEARTDETR